ncbi:MAG: Uma2 family endonuclease, partial [Leptospiraceae bacterium]|nr:Uma2 family endonuclease [Leptospiraceae bacterium]
KGNVIMSPMFARHGFFQARISILLEKFKPNGIIITECAVQTNFGTKVADVTWFTKERWAEVRKDYDVHISPEIAIEVLSLSNTITEMEEKKELYFQSGSLEFWVCDLEGHLHFYDKNSKLSQSKNVPDFPKLIEEV